MSFARPASPWDNPDRVRAAAPSRASSSPEPTTVIATAVVDHDELADEVVARLSIPEPEPVTVDLNRLADLVAERIPAPEIPAPINKTTVHHSKLDISGAEERLKQIVILLCVIAALTLLGVVV